MQGKILIISQEKMRERKFPYLPLRWYSRGKNLVLFSKIVFCTGVLIIVSEKEREKKKEKRNFPRVDISRSIRISPLNRA